jgi:hypothetical protein
MTSINQINAGVIVTQTRMMGLGLNDALGMAHDGPLFNDLNKDADRARTVRMISEIWARDERTKSDPFATFSARLAASNEKAVALFADRWTAALALPIGPERRETLAKMRRAADPRATV